MTDFRVVHGIVILIFGLYGMQVGASNLSGYMVGDYYYVVSSPDEGKEGENAFRFRRIYLTSDWAIDDRFSSRLRFEARDAGWGKSEKIVPFVKHAYLKWRNAFGGADLYLGLSGTPTWSISEKTWGYRSVEKTILDLNELGPSADMGVRVKGKLGGLAYNVMVGNGTGGKSEGDQQKKFYLSFSHRVGESVNAEIYFDYNEVEESVKERTLKVFMGFVGKEGRGGIEAFSRLNDSGNNQNVINGGSVFWAQPLNSTSNIFLRWDSLWNNGKDIKENLLITGFDREVGKGVHIIPNFRIERIESKDTTEVIPYLTAFYKF